MTDSDQPAPDPADELTGAWLVRVLSLPSDRTVVRVEALGADRGFSGRVCRVVLSPGPPETVILKRPSADPTLRRMMASFGLFEREMLFYDRFAGPGCPLRTPRKLGVGEGSDGPVLVLDDLGAATPGDSHAGVAPADALPLVAAAARFHAAWWGAPADGPLAEVPSLDAGPDLPALYARFWPGFAGRFGAELPDWLAACGPGAGPLLAAARRHLAGTPATLLHGDLRLDNLMFDGRSDPIVLDWQTLCRGQGVFDLAYLAAGSLRSHEAEAIDALLKGYCDALAAAGVIGYSPDACRRDYRIAVVFLLARTVSAGATLAFEAGPARDRFVRALARWIDAAETCGAAASLVAGNVEGLRG